MQTFIYCVRGRDWRNEGQKKAKKINKYTHERAVDIH